jgi:hypothetical protein
MKHWRPIATAPKTGEVLILFNPKSMQTNGIDLGKWSPHEEWERVSGGAKLNPTHWMPLPESPLNPSPGELSNEIV